jgi:nucleoside-diphosphate-sugar epimerase
MIPFREEDAIVTKRVCNDFMTRIVALSSIDVYLAFGRIHGTEPGPLEPTPLTEESALRVTNQPNGPDCDKIAVERTYLAEDGVPATILRLPAIYGPRDKYRRLRGYLKRMDDGRPAILLGESLATWKFSRGYVDNVAHAVVLAVGSEEHSGEVFNVAEQDAMTELEFVRAIGQAAGWNGEVKVIPDADLPRHLQQSVDFTQDWNVSTEKIRTHLGYAEILDIPEAFRRTVVWERENPPDSEPFELDYEQEDNALAG